MDVTVQVSGDHELSLAEFLDGCAREATTDHHSSVVRSTLEDLELSGQQEKNKTNDHLVQHEVPQKHGRIIIYSNLVN